MHFALLARLALLIAPSARAAFPGANDKIAFDTDCDGNDEIYTMNADGTNPIRLTNNTGTDVDPAWSPDGSAF